MIYMLLVTVLSNGHPDTQAVALYMSKADCERAKAHYVTKPNTPKVLASGCFPVDKPE